MAEAPQITREARTEPCPMRAAVVGVSLKDATRERPGRLLPALIQNAPSQRRYWDGGKFNPAPSTHRSQPYRPSTGQGGEVTSYDLWTAAEFRTFCHLMDRVVSPVISEAASGKVWLRRFKEKHGEEICEMMLAELRRRDEIAWVEAQRAKRSK